MSTTKEPAFTVSVDGNAVIPHMAERANLNVFISSSGDNKATVAGDVLASARQVEIILKEIAPADDTPAAKEASPLAHWSKSSMSATSHMQHYTDADKNSQQKRVFNARVDFDIRFKEFRALGAFTSKLASLPHVEVKDMQWDLTAATKDRFRSELRRKAALDAVAKAQDYCRALNCTNLRPTAVREGGGGLQAASKAKTTFGSSHTHRQALYAQSAAGFAARSAAPRRMMMAVPGDSDDEEEALALEFEPQELRMNLSVTVDFQADPSPLDQLDTTTTKAASDLDSTEAFEEI